MSEQPQSLMDVRENEDFLRDSRDVQAALVSARPFAQGEKVTPDTPFETEAEANEAADIIKGLKVVAGGAEDHRKALGAPHRQVIEHINSHYKELLSPVTAAVQVLTKRGLAFKRKKEQEHREEEERRREALQKQEEEAAEKAAEAARAAEENPDDTEAQKQAADAHRTAATAAMAIQQRQGADAKPKQLRGSFASLGSVVDFKWDCFDVAALPAECTTFDKKVIDAKIKGEKALAKAEDRDFNLQLIPGVRIWTEERGVSR